MTQESIVGRVLRERSDELLDALRRLAADGDSARLELAASAEVHELPPQFRIGITGGCATTPTEKAMR
jgi:hypothetical protein